MKDFKFCQFTHLSMSPNHCWPSAKLLKLAVSLGIKILPTLWVCQNKKYYYMNVFCLSLLGAWPKATAHSVSSPLQRDLGINLLVPWAFEIWVREWEGEGKQEIGKAEQRCEVNYEKMNGNIYSYRRVGGGDLSITIDYIFLSWYLTTLSRKIWVTLKQFFFLTFQFEILQIHRKGKCTGSFHGPFIQPLPILSSCITTVHYQSQETDSSSYTCTYCVSVLMQFCHTYNFM